MKEGRLRSVLRPRRVFEPLVVSGNDVFLLRDGAEGFPSMLQAIAAAEHEILLEMYWFASDATGGRFARALEERARAGVTVRVIYDAVGSWGVDEGMFRAMRRAGCEVREYNPIAPWRQRFNVGVVNNRDHRKILVVDGWIGFTGGINIGDAWAPEEDGGGGWRDDMVRVEGPVMQQMRDLFLYTWHAMSGPGGAPDLGADASSDAEGDGSDVRVLATRYRGEQRAIRHAYLSRIATAKRRIFITNSYFVPDGRIRRGLARAARRGVDVRVLLPGENDVPAVHFAARRLYTWLMQYGVSLYEWQGPILHAKSAVIDGRWCTVGSYNLDWRSWRFNLEVAVAVEDPSVAALMDERFHEDLEHSSRVDAHHWRFRPLSERLLERFFFLFRKLL